MPSDFAVSAPARRRRSDPLGMPALLAVGLTIALLAALIITTGVGQLNVPPAQVLGTLLEPLGIRGLPLPELETAQRGLWTIRFPRAAMAAIVGAALAVAGLLMQAIFGNPLAEPGVVGVSSGAAVGAGCASSSVSTRSGSGRCPRSRSSQGSASAWSCTA
ncbi:hypothetical protein GCM10025863_17180 [Microbacterium suwonense]|uniref:Hemin transport system permease protein HmuU n=1 Tax=Microbacterium suwonense TaxID=683047 RepID=A0ABM8FU62_9MICO|nr:hypothetical protein GCM10025863_17180 [Microbacterium suwonense]